MKNNVPIEILETFEKKQLREGLLFDPTLPQKLKITQCKLGEYHQSYTPFKFLSEDHLNNSIKKSRSLGQILIIEPNFSKMFEGSFIYFNYIHIKQGFFTLQRLDTINL